MVITPRDIIDHMVLTNEQLERYCRQIVLPQVGKIGQEKLLNAKVLVIGAGGLGSSVLYNLAACGVGTIGIIDFDNVELSNLHRQIIHTTMDIGKPKTQSAKEKINLLNLDVNVVSFEEKLTEQNVQSILKGFEIIVDGLDNFKDKFLVNKHCVLLNKKLVHAGVLGFEGQILTVLPGSSACLNCLLESSIQTDFYQTCKEIGVLGTCVNVLSTLQANEVIKLILDIGELYTNKVLKFNALSGKFYEFKIDTINKECNICNKLAGLLA